MALRNSQREKQGQKQQQQQQNDEFFVWLVVCLHGTEGML